MFETYSESAKGVKITAERAALECRKHGADFSEMVAELGQRETYKASDVLAWLGY